MAVNFVSWALLCCSVCLFFAVEFQRSRSRDSVLGPTILITQSLTCQPQVRNKFLPQLLKLSRNRWIYRIRYGEKWPDKSPLGKHPYFLWYIIREFIAWNHGVYDVRGTPSRGPGTVSIIPRYRQLKTELLWKGKRQYLRTCKVSRYCLWALHGRAALRRCRGRPQLHDGMPPRFVPRCAPALRQRHSQRIQTRPGRGTRLRHRFNAGPTSQTRLRHRFNAGPTSQTSASIEPMSQTCPVGGLLLSCPRFNSSFGLVLGVANNLCTLKGTGPG